MSPMLHPFPWKMTEDDRGTMFVVDSCEKPIFNSRRSAMRPVIRLVSASPDLLAALIAARHELRLLNVMGDGRQNMNSPAWRVLGEIERVLGGVEGFL